MKSSTEGVVFAGLAGTAIGGACGIALSATGHATLSPGLGLALSVSAAIGLLTTAFAAARARRWSGFSTRACFGILVATATCVTLRRLGLPELSLIRIDAGSAPCGQLALLTMPLVGLATAIVTELDARRPSPARSPGRS